MTADELEEYYALVVKLSPIYTQRQEPTASISDDIEAVTTTQLRFEIRLR